MGRLDQTKLNLVETLDDCNAMMRWLGERHENNAIACDTETGGLEWWRQPLRLVQLGDTAAGWAVPWDRWAGVVLEALTKWEGELLFHNAKFDGHFLSRCGGWDVPWHRVHDTSVMAHILQPDRPRGLKFLGDVLVDRRSSAGQQALHDGMSKAGWTWGTVPADFQPYWAYAALDPVLTAHLFDVFKPQINERNLWKLYDLERAAMRICFNMETRGARIDVKYCEETRAKLEDFVIRQRGYVQGAWGVDPGKTAQCTRRLQEDGVELSKLTKGGTNYALDKEVLDEIDHPMAAEILKYRQAQKILTSYFDNLLDMRNGDVIHCSINTLGTRTGRMSITDPALQTLPRGGESNPFADLVRAAFIPREGHLLISCDLDQIEARLLAHYAADPDFCDAIRRGDIHTESARKIFNDPELVKSDPRRQVTKNCIFAILYGAGTAKMAQTAGISVEEGAIFMNEFNRTFPGIRNFTKTVENVARQRLQAEGQAYVYTPYGRFQPTEHNKLYTLVNYMIQGGAADYFKDCLTRLDAAGFGETMLLPVHDEVIVEAEAAVAQEQAAEVERLMSDTENWRVPFTAGANVMERWKKG